MHHSSSPTWQTYLSFALFGTLGLFGTATAATIQMNASDSFYESSFAAGTHWVGGAAPSSGNDYEVNGYLLRTASSGSQTFLGNALILTGTGSLTFKTSGLITVNNLRLNGGSIHNAGLDLGSGGTGTLAGNITLTAAGGSISTIGTADRYLIINSKITGLGALTVVTDPVQNSVTLNGANDYTGGTILAGNGAQVKLGNATALGAASGSLNLNHAAAVLDLNNFNQTIGKLTGLAGSKITNGLAGSRTITVGSGTLAVDSSTYAGIIQNGSGTVGLTKTGSGTQSLTAAQTYTGATLVSGGTLAVSGSGSINGSSGVTVNGGTLNYSSSTNLTAALTFTSGTLAGTNYAGKTLSIGATQTISPGNSTGTLTSGAQTWAAGGTYTWEINDANGAPGVDGWDLISLNDALTLTATSGSKFNINVVSLASQSAGLAANFNASQNYEWLIADAVGAITLFDSAAFNLNLTGFQNSYSGIWSVALGGSGSVGGDNSQIYVTYSAIPEPSTTLLLSGGLMALVLLRRRRSF